MNIKIELISYLSVFVSIPPSPLPIYNIIMSMLNNMYVSSLFNQDEKCISS